MENFKDVPEAAEHAMKKSGLLTITHESRPQKRVKSVRVLAESSVWL